MIEQFTPYISLSPATSYLVIAVICAVAVVVATAMKPFIPNR